MVKNRSVKKSNSSTNPDRVRTSTSMRDKSTINRLKMYKKGGKVTRNRQGQVIKPAQFQTSVKSGEVARVQPNSKWFGNTRVITQSALQKFQNEMGKVMKDPYKVVMRQTGLPISLLNEKSKNSCVHILDTESFENTFGPKAQRKKPHLTAGDMEGMIEVAQSQTEMYDMEKDRDLVTEEPDFRPETRECIFNKGQSKRIWNELYKVVDSSDVVIQVLDARDPQGTRSRHIEHYLRKEKPHKHLVFLLNKCDLVPTWVTKRWVTILSAECPTLAFHASLTKSFGKGALINLLRQFAKLHKDRKQISVGFIGYPNVGKSAIINTLRSKKVCNVAPIAGETKVWQYITLMRRIYLIDCPGVVYPSGDSDTEIVLKGVVRVENVKEPSEHIPAVLDRVRPEYLRRTYQVSSWNDFTDFLEKVAAKSGKLLKGGEPDINSVAKMILNDFQRGKLPHFVKPTMNLTTADTDTRGQVSMNESQDDVSFNESHTEVSMNMNELRNTTDEFQNMSEMEEEIDEGSDFEMDDREMESRCEEEEEASSEGDLSMEGVIIEEEKQAVIKDDGFQEEIHLYKEQGSVEEKIHLLEDAKTITLLSDEEKMDQNEMKNGGKRISVDNDEEKTNIEYESTSVAGLSDAALQGSTQSASNVENVESKSSQTNQKGANEDCTLQPNKILSLVQLAKNVCVHMNIDIPANNSITDVPEAPVLSSLDENSLVVPKNTGNAHVFNENPVAEFHAARQGISAQLKITKETKSNMCSENTSLVTNKGSTSLLRESMEITSSVTSDSSPEDILKKYDLCTNKDNRKSETPSLFLCGQYMSVSSDSECPVISYGGRKRPRYVDTEDNGSRGIEEENKQKRREDENAKDITSSSPSVFKSSSNLRKSGLHSHLDPDESSSADACSNEAITLDHKSGEYLRKNDCQSITSKNCDVKHLVKPQTRYISNAMSSPSQLISRPSAINSRSGGVLFVDNSLVTVVDCSKISSANEKNKEDKVIDNKRRDTIAKRKPSGAKEATSEFGKKKVYSSIGIMSSKKASLIEKLKKKQGRLERQADSDDEDTTDLKKKSSRGISKRKIGVHYYDQVDVKNRRRRKH